MGLDASQMEDSSRKGIMRMKVGFYASIIFVAMLLFTAGCAKKEPVKSKEASEEPKPAEAPKGASESVQQKILSFNLEGLGEKGKKIWEVRGESATAVSENEIELNHIVAKSYGNEAEATITAEKGIYDKLKNNVRLEENVKATVENAQSFAEGRTSLTPQLSGPAPKGDDAVAKKTKTVITCDGEVEFDYEKNLASFNKNVKVTGDDGTIDADKITIHLDPDTKKIKDIVAEDNVKIQRGENTTYSEKATYIEAEKKVVLTGKPRLVIYQEEGKESFLE